MAETPQMNIRYVNADGTLTLAGYALFEDMANRLAASETKDTTQDATLADHETRITALEP